MALLEIRNVTRRFGDFVAVDDVSLSIEAGEFFCLLGPSGCGKTTLLRLVAGFDAPDGGSVWIDGTDMTGIPPEGRNVHTVFQSYALFPHMTVAENIAFPLKMSKVPAARDPRHGRGGARGRLADRHGRTLPERAVRRSAPACRGGAGAGHAPTAVAARRAPRRARCQAQGEDAARADRPAEGGGHRVRLRHARPAGSPGAVAPDRGHEQGQGRAAR